MKKVKLLALVSAVVAAFLLYLFLNTLNHPVEVETTSVVTAIVDIPANTPITADMLKLTELPTEAVLSGTISNSTDAVGKVSQVEIYQGEQLLSAKLISAGDTGNDTLAYAIEPNMRAITISVDDTTGLSNMITPGNHVDVIGYFLIDGSGSSSNSTDTSTDSTTQKQSYTAMILENITVLAVDNVLSKEGKLNSETPTYATITLQVTAEQAMKLSMSQFEGQLRVVLRSPLDETETTLPNITLNDVLN